MIDKKLHDLKTKILRTENIDDAMREELVNDIFEIEKLVSSSNVIHDVSLSCYLFKVDKEDCFVLGENISDAIDRLEKEEPNAEYELVHSKSLDCIY